MLIKRQPDLTYADVTPKGFYMGRRNFLLGLLATGAAVEAYKKLPGLVSAAVIGFSACEAEWRGQMAR